MPHELEARAAADGAEALEFRVEEGEAPRLAAAVGHVAREAGHGPFPREQVVHARQEVLREGLRLLVLKGAVVDGGQGQDGGFGQGEGLGLAEAAELRVKGRLVGLKQALDLLVDLGLELLAIRHGQLAALFDGGSGLLHVFRPAHVFVIGVLVGAVAAAAGIVAWIVHIYLAMRRKRKGIQCFVVKSTPRYLSASSHVEDPLKHCDARDARPALSISCRFT